MASQRAQLEAEARRKATMRKLEKLAEQNPDAMVGVHDKLTGVKRQPQVLTFAGSDGVEQNRRAIAQQRISEGDDLAESLRRSTARAMEAAYGGSGAYGRGIDEPGGKPVVPKTAPLAREIESNRKSGSNSKVDAAVKAYLNAVAKKDLELEKDQNSEASAKAIDAMHAAAANIESTKAVYGDQPDERATPAVTAAPVRKSRIVYGMGANGTPLLTNKTDDELYTAMEEKFGPEAQTYREAPVAPAADPAKAGPASAVVAELPMQSSRGVVSTDTPAAASSEPVTRTLKDGTKVKVIKNADGVWEEVG